MIYDAMYKGLDTTNYVKFDLKTSNFRMEDIYVSSLEGKRYTGILEYSKLESIIGGFELFTKQIIVPKPPATPPLTKGFNLGYSVEQLTSLHKALIHENYLTGTVTDFINAFTGNPIKDKLEWIDKAQRVKSVNSHTLLQLLFSLNISLQDDRKVINQNVKDSINYVFSNNFGNINSKYNGFIELYTERQKNISTIVQKALNLN